MLWRAHLPSTVPRWPRLLRGAALTTSALLVAALVATGLLSRAAWLDIRNHSAPQITSATGLYFAINDMDAQLADQLMFGTNPDLADDRRTAARIYDERRAQAGVYLRDLSVAAQGDPVAGASVAQAIADYGKYEADAALALPVPLVDPTDPNAGFLAGLAAAAPAELVTALRTAPVDSVEKRLQDLRARLEMDDVDEASRLLTALADDDLDDWRVVWHRGVTALTTGDHETAALAFDAVYDAFPGESAPKPALAICAEVTGRPANASAYYRLVWSTDERYVSAAFGLARVLLASGDRAGAVAAVESVPESSIHFTAARVAAIRSRLRERSPQEPLLDDLRAAAAQVEELRQLGIDTDRREQLSTEVLGSALDWVLSGSPAPGSSGHCAALDAPAAPARRCRSRPCAASEWVTTYTSMSSPDPSMIVSPTPRENSVFSRLRRVAPMTIWVAFTSRARSSTPSAVSSPVTAWNVPPSSSTRACWQDRSLGDAVASPSARCTCTARNSPPAPRDAIRLARRMSVSPSGPPDRATSTRSRVLQGSWMPWSVR